MAEGREYTVENSEDFMCCSVCMEEYEDPRALPCLHTFCYKCLIELSMQGGEECGPSDTSLQVAALKLEFASYVPSSNIPKQQQILKCPLCAEEHIIPKDKGVAGFRKDFRINKLIDQQKMKDIEVQRNLSQEDTEAPPETCPFHPNEKMMYHCESDTCDCDICEQCWSSTHDSHIVKLLSKKVKDAKETLQQQMESGIVQISSQINILSKTKKSMAEQNATLDHNLHQRFEDMQQKLNNAFQKTCHELDMHKKLQDKKMSDELQSLCVLQDTFKQIRSSLEKENLPQISKTVTKYTSMYGKMQQLTEDLAQWSFTYTRAQLPEYSITDEFLNALSVNYHEANLGRKTEGGKEHGRHLRREKKSARQGKKGERGPRQSKEGKEEKSQAVGPASPARLQSSEVNLKWEHFLVQRKPNIEGITATKNDDVFMVTRDEFSCYKTSPPKKVFEYNLENENIDAIAIATSKAGSVDFLVKLDTNNNTLKFVSSKGKTHPYDYVSKFIRVQNETHKILASSSYYVCYPFNEGQKLFVGFLTLDNDSPEISPFGVPIQVPFGSGRVRSMCVYVSNKGNPVLVCANLFQPGKTEKSDNAIVAMTKQIVHWKVTFADLDPDASNFDLKDMACDKDNIFVLNNRANAVYHVSKNGSCVRKVNLVGVPPKFHLSSPANICLDARSKSLFIAHFKDIISKFSYT